MEDDEQDEFEPFAWDPMGWETNFVDNMKVLREQHGMSQSEFARRAREQGLAFHQPTVQRIESGRRPLRLTEAIVIASMLGSDLRVMMERLTPRIAYSILASDLAKGQVEDRIDDVVSRARSLTRLREVLNEELEEYLAMCAEVSATPNEDAVAYAQAAIGALDKVLPAVGGAATEAVQVLTWLRAMARDIPEEWHLDGQHR